MDPYRRNLYLIYLRTLSGGFVFFLPIFALYLESKLFSIFNVTLVLSIQALSIVILEIPTGIISDKFGRKISLLFSNLTGILYILMLILSTNLVHFSLTMILGGLSFTLSSGSDTAILFESVENESFLKIGVNVIWVDSYDEIPLVVRQICSST